MNAWTKKMRVRALLILFHIKYVEFAITQFDQDTDSKCESYVNQTFPRPEIFYCPACSFLREV